MTACIVGWSHTRFGKHEKEDIESLITGVATDAIRDAGLAPADIDEIFVGTMNAGFVRQEFPSSLALQADAALRFKPVTRVENACATGSAAIHSGLNSIEAKRARKVLVIGVEKMSEVTGPAVGDILIRAAYLKEEGAIDGRFRRRLRPDRADVFSALRDKSDALARIAAKNHKNGALNPLAQMQKDLGYDLLPHGL